MLLLRAERGQFLALERLSEGAKAGVHPLIELPPLSSYDHDLGGTTEEVGQAVELLCRRLESKWAGRPCFIDVAALPADARLPDGGHPSSERDPPTGAGHRVWRRARGVARE